MALSDFNGLFIQIEELTKENGQLSNQLQIAQAKIEAVLFQL